MDRPLRILGIAGSLRSQSYNRQLLRAAQQLAPAGVELTIFEGLGALPHYDADVDTAEAPQSVRELRAAIADADAVLFVTPEYNGSVPGLLKNAVDWASRPRGEAALASKPVAITGTSTGQYGGLWAQTDLKKILGVAGARVVGAEVAVPKAQDIFDEQGQIVDARQRDRIAAHLHMLANDVRTTLESTNAVVV